jgi:hypothetical protein
MSVNLCKTTTYRRTIFKAEIIQEAFALLIRLSSDKDMKSRQCDRKTLAQGDVRWVYDADEEFFADYRKGCTSARIVKNLKDSELEVSIEHYLGGCFTSVAVGANSRARAEAICEVFERQAQASKLPEAIDTQEPKKPTNPTIFVGHGRNPQWKELKDHLHEQHGYEIVAYEIGAKRVANIDVPLDRTRQVNDRGE